MTTLIDLNLRAIMSEIRRMFASPGEEDLHVCTCDPLACAVNNSRLSTFWVIFLSGCFFLLAKIVVNMANGTLTSQTLLSDFSVDFAYSNLFWPLKLINDVINRLGLHGIPLPTHVSSYGDRLPLIPYLRDYADMLLMALMSFGIGLMLRQWRTISGLPMRLWKDGVLNRNVFNEEAIGGFIHEHNHWFGSQRLRLISITMSLGFTSYFFWLVSSFGLYPALRPATASVDWEQLAYQGWWSNPSIAPVPFGLNFIVYVVVFYYLVMHSLVGIGAIRMLLRANRTAKSANQPLLIPQVLHYDELAGLSTFRNAMAQVFWSVVLTAVLVTVSSFYLPSRSPMPFLFSSPLPLVLWAVFVNPLFLIVPLFVIHRHLTVAKARLLKDTYEDICSLNRRAHVTNLERKDTLTLQLIQKYAHYSEIRQMPTSIFPFTRLARYAVIYAVTISALIADAAALTQVFG